MNNNTNNDAFDYYENLTGQTGPRSTDGEIGKWRAMHAKKLAGLLDDNGLALYLRRSHLPQNCTRMELLCDMAAAHGVDISWDAFLADLGI